MSIGRFSLAVILSAVTMIVLAGVWHEVVMAQIYKRHAGGSHEGTGIIFVAYFLLATMMVYLFSQWKNRKNSMVSGLKFGSLIGLLWVFPHELAMAGAHGDAISYVLFNATWHTIEQASGGVVIAWLYHDDN